MAKRPPPPKSLKPAPPAAAVDLLNDPVKMDRALEFVLKMEQLKRSSGNVRAAIVTTGIVAALGEICWLITKVVDNPPASAGRQL